MSNPLRLNGETSAAVGSTMDQTAACTRCGETKPLGEFHKNSTRLGRHTRCKSCRKEIMALNPSNPQRIRETGLVRLYGITPDDYDRMYGEQSGACAICHKPETMTRLGTVRNLCVDHDHRTGKVRGLLCASCNFALGKLGDDPEVIRSAAKYLLTSLEPTAVATP